MDFGGKSYCLNNEDFFPPTCLFKEKRYKNLSLSDFVVWFFSLKLCASIKESGGVSCVFLDCVSP